MTCTFTTEDNYPIILYSLVKGVVFIQCMPNVDDYDFFFWLLGQKIRQTALSLQLKQMILKPTTNKGND